MDLLSAIGRTPLVQLRHIGAGLPVPILAKCEHCNPGGSVKDRMAKAILDDAAARGLLHPGMTIVEATAGNTGVGLALVAAVRGYRLVCVLPEKMSVDKRESLRLLGAEVIVVPNAPPSAPENFRNTAARLAREHGWFAPQQFENPANPAVHEHTTAVELLEQTGGRIGAFVAGAGTGGTLTGVARALRRACPDAKIVLADPTGSALAQWIETGTLGPDGSYLVEGIGASVPPANLDRTLVHAAVSIDDADSFAMVRRLVREEGLLVGGSSGTNVAAALGVARTMPLDGPVVTVLADGWDRYRSQAWMLGW